MQKDWFTSLLEDQIKTPRRLVKKLPNTDDIKETVNEIIKGNLANWTKLNEQLKISVTVGVAEFCRQNSCMLKTRICARREPDSIILDEICIRSMSEAKFD